MEQLEAVENLVVGTLHQLCKSYEAAPKRTRKQITEKLLIKAQRDVVGHIWQEMMAIKKDEVKTNAE